jgi:NAD(P)-dependent dehydrogenase (short-subunit alcohol dehydrogenase family)
MKEFKDKVAVVTGAASGIGYSLAERAGREGMKVVLADVDNNALEKAEKKIKAIGATTLAVRTDVSKAQDVENLAQKSLDHFGAVHLLFNNAGVGAGLSIWDSPLTDWQLVLGINLWGVIYGVHFFVPIMLKQDSECHIVNTASTAGLITSTNQGPYATSKHAIVALSETLYKQLEAKQSKIHISILCPSYTKTNLVESVFQRLKKLQDRNGRAIDEEIRVFLEMAKHQVDNGISPDEVADLTFNAIKEGKFYIYPDTGIIKQLIQTRMEDILQERNPTTVPINLK